MDRRRNCVDDRGVTRRTVLQAAGAGLGLWFVGTVAGRPVAWEVAASAAEQDSLLDAALIPPFVAPLLVPPVMPRTGRAVTRGGKNVDLYDITVTQLEQQVLPSPLPRTVVWGYAAPDGTVTAPSATIEARWRRPARITWRNGLLRADGSFLPHLLPVDPTLHWANPPGGVDGRDSTSEVEAPVQPYTGPVPVVTHVHGAVAVGDESDGYPEAWFLPPAVDIPAGYATEGTWYGFFRDKAHRDLGLSWEQGSATAEYPNDQPAATLWYHDHTLGMTRLNVYAGPAGFYLVRGGPAGDGAVLDRRTGKPAVLPGPAPREGDGPRPATAYREIALAIQDRSFQESGALYYPDTRAVFDGVTGPYAPESDVPPIWNPEFFGSTIVVNGRTWPHHVVEQQRYRLRLLNGCTSRFLVLDFSEVLGARVWQIGSEGGLLPAALDLTGTAAGRVLLAPAERADVVLDLTAVAPGSYVVRNLGPDHPFSGGEPGTDFTAADPATTGLVLRLDVVPATGPDLSTPPEHLVLPAVPRLPDGPVRPLALLEQMSSTVVDEEGMEVPAAALLGTLGLGGVPRAHLWHEPVTENPAEGSVETWAFHNLTADAHPIHVHEVMFQVVDRQAVSYDDEIGVVVPTGLPRLPEPAEAGWKDTVVTYPGEVTRVRMRFGRAGQYVWHCHVVEHEDNEMMRPLRVGPEQPGQPMHGA